MVSAKVKKATGQPTQRSEPKSSSVEVETTSKCRMNFRVEKGVGGKSFVKGLEGDGNSPCFSFCLHFALTATVFFPILDVSSTSFSERSIFSKTLALESLNPGKASKAISVAAWSDMEGDGNVDTLMDSVFNWYIMIQMIHLFFGICITLQRNRVAPLTIAIVLGPMVSKWEESVGFSDPEGDSRILPIESLLSWHGPVV